jgi:carboxypeptidase C (cathepsin A)
MNAYWNNATVQYDIGVLSSLDQEPRKWEAHAFLVHQAYIRSGDWDVRTDFLFERLLRSGVGILKYEGMVDCELGFSPTSFPSMHYPFFTLATTLVRSRMLAPERYSMGFPILLTSLDICNYLGIRKIMANLPEYKHQDVFNSLTMEKWYPHRGDKHPAGKYKCLKGEEGSGEGTMCYLEIDDAGHVLSLDRPREGSLMISKWMRDLTL